MQQVLTARGSSDDGGGGGGDGGGGRRESVRARTAGAPVTTSRVTCMITMYAPARTLNPEVTTTAIL